MRVVICLLIIAYTNLTLAESIRPRPISWAQPLIGVESQNIFKVSEKVYRSAQPDDDENHELKSIGIGEILNLRENHTDDDDIKDKSIILHRVEMNAGDITDAKIIAALRVIKGAKEPILVHCWHGSDRTGVVIAMYRILFENWTKQQAIDELVNGGFGYHDSIYPNITEYIKNVDIEQIKAKL